MQRINFVMFTRSLSAAPKPYILKLEVIILTVFIIGKDRSSNHIYKV